MSGLGVSIDDESLCVVHVGGHTATGFAFMKREWVVTAAHVVIEHDKPRDSIAVAFLGGATEDARLIFRHPLFNLAVLEVAGSSACQNPLFPSDARFTPGKGLVCVGYSPVLSDTGVARYTSCANPVRSFVWDERRRDAMGEDSILFEAPWAEPGSSGGPCSERGAA